MELNVLLPLLSSTLSFVFALFLLDQWLERRHSYQLIWTIGMAWYGISAGTEFWGAAYGWSEPLYRTWYLIGAVYVAAWLGLGTMFLLGRTRFGYGAAISFVLAGLFTFLSWRRYEYADAAGTEALYPLVAVVAAVAIAVATYRSKGQWAPLAGVLIVGGSLLAVPVVLLAPLEAPGYVLDASGIPVGDAMPGYARLLTPLFNVTGGFALAFGALYSTYVFMPKQRVLRYDLRRDRGVLRFLFNLLFAPVAITVNLIASIPGTVVAQVQGRLHSRVPATILLAIGGFVPSVTSGLSRFGVTETFFLGELLGVVFLFAGFLVSIEVFREIRIPFTRRVLRVRHEAA
ncbi:MAG: hypothetical protein A2V85_12460 [Chloroflexi bacterium RBG_16_72_14]|nr:MAG: hypothetical protein A2V85_12460 [Chloroflexi bacterium RBG_16_72_14]